MDNTTPKPDHQRRVERWREAILVLRVELIEVLETAIARGEVLGYSDDEDYRDRLDTLRGLVS